jgi:hypothetical protein
VQHVENKPPSKPFPVWGCLSGALAVILGYLWTTTASAADACSSVLVQAANQQACAHDLAMHNGTAVAGLVLGGLAVVCFVKRW